MFARNKHIHKGSIITLDIGLDFYRRSGDKYVGEKLFRIYNLQRWNGRYLLCNVIGNAIAQNEIDL